jgi:hypothetical protein
MTSLNVENLVCSGLLYCTRVPTYLPTYHLPYTESQFTVSFRVLFHVSCFLAFATFIYTVDGGWVEVDEATGTVRYVVRSMPILMSKV